MPTIAVLPGIGVPSAIVGRIFTFIIDALKSQSGRALPHVGKEVSEGAPAVTDADSATSVIGEIGVVRVTTSLMHSFPAMVGRRAGLPVLRSLALEGVEAPAALGVAASEAYPPNCSHIAAVADDKPAGDSLFHVREPGDSQSSETLVGDIFDRHSARVAHFYGYGHYATGGLGLVVLIIVILLVMGRI